MSGSLPHLLFFNPDQWRGQTLGHLGDPAAQTPNLDGLAREGVSFSQAFCQSPVCVPSRCSFMTGLYPHTRGHRTMHYMLRESRGDNHLLKALKESGYFVFWAGKNDLISGDEDLKRHCDVYFKPTEDDFDRWGLTARESNHQSIEAWRSEPGGDGYYSFLGGALEAENEPLFADPDWACVLGAVDFIRNYSGDKPLCVFLPLLYPHPPFVAEQPWYSMIEGAKLPKRIPVPSAEQFDRLPRAMKALHEGQGLAEWSEERWTELRAVYYGMCARVDHQFGRICDALRERGIYDDTGVFVFSDHGEYAGDYGLVEKAQNLFQDCLTRVPFLFRPPKGVPCQPGVRDELVELVDFPATVCDLTGIDLGQRQFGRSLLPLVAGDPVPWRDAVYCEGGRLPGESEASECGSNQSPMGLYYPRMKVQASEEPFFHGKGTMIRTSTHKYVYRPFERCELYDLVSDSAEIDNRIDDPTLIEVRRQLEGRILRWLVETGDIVPREPDPRRFEIKP